MSYVICAMVSTPLHLFGQWLNKQVFFQGLSLGFHCKNHPGKEECKDWWCEQSTSRRLWWKQFAVSPGKNFVLLLILMDEQEVTSDVLARGIFSERGLKSAIDYAVAARLGKVPPQKDAD